MEIKYYAVILLLLCSTAFGLSDQEHGANVSMTGDGAIFSMTANSQTADLKAHPSATESYTHIWPAAKGTTGQALIIDSVNVDVITWIYGTPSTSADHRVTGPTHNDAATGTVQRGDILVGNADATSLWKRLGISSTIGSTITKIVGTNGTDSGFRTLANFALDIESLLDHGSFAGLGDDDHPLHPLVDGTRGFTDVVPGISPTANNHLVIKEYVDISVAGLHFDMFFDNLDSGINDPVSANDYLSLQDMDTGDAVTTSTGDALGAGDDQEVISYISGAEE